MNSEAFSDSYELSGSSENSISSSYDYKRKLKNMKPMLTSTAVSLFKAAAVCSTQQQSFQVKVASTPMKRVQRSSTKRAFLKLKKSIMTSTLITKKSDIENLSSIKERTKKKRKLLPQMNSTAMTKTATNLLDFKRLNYPTRYCPNMRVKDINRLFDYQQFATDINGSVGFASSLGSSFHCSSFIYGDVKMWIV